MQSKLKKRATFLVVAIVFASFALWGVADYAGVSSGGDAFVTVGEHEASVDEAWLRLQQRLRAAGQSVEAVLEDPQLVDSIALELGRELQLKQLQAELDVAFSDALVAQIIQRNAVFQDSEGKFNSEGYLRTLRQLGYTEAAFLEASKLEILNWTLREALPYPVMPIEYTSSLLGLESATPTYTPRNAVIAYDYWISRYQRQTAVRDVAVALFAPNWLAPSPEPSQSEIETYYQSVQERFAHSRLQTVNLMVLTPEEVPATIAPEQLESLYDQRKDSFTTAQQRAWDHWVFADLAAAQDALVQVAGIPPLSVSQLGGKPPVVNELRTQAEITDSKLAQGVFAASEQTLSEPISGQIGVYVVRVREVVPAKTAALSDVQDQLISEYNDRLRLEFLDSLNRRVSDQLLAGVPLTDIAAESGVDVIALPWHDSERQTVSGRPVQLDSDVVSAEALTTVVAQAFAQPRGIVTIADQLRIAFEVTGTRPAGVPELAEIRDLIILDFANRQRLDDARRRAESAFASLPAETITAQTFAQAQSSGLVSFASDANFALNRNSIGNLSLPSQVQEAMGTTPAGSRKLIDTADGSWILEVRDVKIQPLSSSETQLALIEATSLSQTSQTSSRNAWLNARFPINIDSQGFAERLKFTIDAAANSNF